MTKPDFSILHMLATGGKVAKSCSLALVLGLFSLPAFAESPNDVVAEALNLLDREIKTRKEELSNDRQALHAAIDDILLSCALLRAMHRTSVSHAEPPDLPAMTLKNSSSSIRNRPGNRMSEPRRRTCPTSSNSTITAATTKP